MTQISIRMDEALLEQTDKILNELGLNMSTAVNIFARQIVRTRGIPFPLTLDQTGSTRQEALKSFIQYAQSNPVKLRHDEPTQEDTIAERLAANYEFDRLVDASKDEGKI